ncbi:hypothetical protein [Pseudoalteromonas piscicida]|uniref:hypothetical protein n=1 Tax=Pseudoalteromonas piscicida TaxID=43662 RepID=UPI0030AD9B5E
MMPPGGMPLPNINGGDARSGIGDSAFTNHGKLGGLNYNKGIPHLIRLAEQHNCTSIRWHTLNPNAIRHGFKHLPAELIEVRKGLFHNEYVYRLVLNGR